MTDRCRIPPLLSYYGSKWRLALKYPKPDYPTIIEPFAGGAGYSCLYSDRDIVLVEKYYKLARVLKFLVSATKRDILDLPLLKHGQTVHDFGLEDVQKWLIGWWVQQGVYSPRLRLSTWVPEDNEIPVKYWGRKCRGRLANSVGKISHWKVIEGDYTNAPDIEATWFIDPPYQSKGKYYPVNDIDYNELTEWVRERKGQVIVCENEGADWLPFRRLCYQIGASKDGSSRRRSAEVVWTKNCKETL